MKHIIIIANETYKWWFALGAHWNQGGSVGPRTIFAVFSRCLTWEEALDKVIELNRVVLVAHWDVRLRRQWTFPLMYGLMAAPHNGWNDPSFRMLFLDTEDKPDYVPIKDDFVVEGLGINHPAKCLIISPGGAKLWKDKSSPANFKEETGIYHTQKALIEPHVLPDEWHKFANNCSWEDDRDTSRVMRWELG